MNAVRLVDDDLMCMLGCNLALGLKSLGLWKVEWDRKWLEFGLM
jgi:hypothetical protein